MKTADDNADRRAAALAKMQEALAELDALDEVNAAIHLSHAIELVGASGHDAFDPNGPPPRQRPDQ